MIRLAVERPVSTLIGALTLMVLGLFSLLRLPVSLLPNVERPQLVITARADDRSREELLLGVTEPLERRLASLAGVTSIRSETGDGISRVVVESEWQTDPDRLRIETERRLAALEDAPRDLTVELAVGDKAPIVEVAVLGGSSPGARTAFVRKVLAPELARLQGAGRLELLGLAPRHVVVTPRSAALAARDLTAADLVARLSRIGLPESAGRARAGGTVRPLVVREAVYSLEQLRSLTIPTKGSTSKGSISGPPRALLRDVADVSLETLHDGSWFRLDGEDGALVRIFRAPGANAVALAERIRERVAELSRRGTSEMTGNTTGDGTLTLRLVSDSSGEVVDALRQLGLAALVGLFLGTLVLRALLGRWAPTLALAVVIPASIITAFAAFYLWNISLDVVSLAGLALAAGMLVDNSIVVLEAIESARERQRQGGDRNMSPALAGGRQIAGAVVAGFVTTAVVFLPLLYLHGLARAFFGTQAFAIVSSLAVSLLFSLTVTPVLSGGRQRGPRQEVSAATTGGSHPGRRAYLRLLRPCLRHPWLVLLPTLILLAAAAQLGRQLPRELMPDAAARTVLVTWQAPPGLTLDDLEARGGAVEAAVRRAAGPGLVQLVSARGADEERSRTLPGNDLGRRDSAGTETGIGHLELTFGAETADTAERLSALEAAVRGVAGIRAQVDLRQSAFVEVLERARRRVEIEVSAAEPARAEALAERVRAHVAERLGISPYREQLSRPRPALRLSWDEARLSELQLDRAALESQVRAALGPQLAGRVDMPGVEPEIRVERSQPADLATLPIGPVRTPGDNDARVLPLAALAQLHDDLRPPREQRFDGRPSVRLVLDVDPRGLAARRLQAVLDELPLAADEAVRPGGAALELQRSFGQLLLALALSVVLVFLTLAATYESLRLPAVVMSTVPVAAAGAVALLTVAGQTLNVMSFLGLILLTGIVVNNAIVLVHRVEQLRRAGAAALDALSGAAAERYRPILMTTITTLLGMLPLALLGGEGVELRRALSLAVLGGLVTSTFASLLLVPALYRLATHPEKEQTFRLPERGDEDSA